MNRRVALAWLVLLSSSAACAPTLVDDDALGTVEEPIVIKVVDVNEKSGPEDAVVGGQCFAERLDARGGTSPCVITEAFQADTCGCDVAGRVPVAPEHTWALEVARDLPEVRSRGWNCFCEIPEVTGPDADACLSEPDFDAATGDGYCYLDRSATPPIGSPAIAGCPPEMPRLVRFVGAGSPSRGAIPTPSAAVFVCRAR